jgi:hypothetical protein
MKLNDGTNRTLPALLAFGLLALGTAPAPGAISVLVEAESYVDAMNIGGASIMSVVCTSASEGYAVDGLDIAGEWIEVKVTLLDEACYELLLGYQAPYEETIETLMTVFDDAHVSVEGAVEFSFVGAGLG